MSGKSPHIALSMFLICLQKRTVEKRIAMVDGRRDAVTAIIINLKTLNILLLPELGHFYLWFEVMVVFIVEV